MKNSTSPLRKEFWDINKRLLKVGSTGKLYYTQEGKAEYRALFANHGFALENVTSLDEFRRVMKSITAGQMEDSNAQMLRLIHDPSTPELDRILLCKVLKMAVPVLTAPAPLPSAEVVSMSAWQARTKTATAKPQ